MRKIVLKSRFTKASFNRLATILALFSMIILSAQTVLAGTLTTPRDYLNRQKSAQTTGIQHEIFFTVTNAVSGGLDANKVTLTFPDGDNWCGTAGTDLVVTGIANPTGATESATALPTNTALAGQCTQGANDAIIITNVNNLSAATKYGVRVADGSTGKLGSPAAGNNIKVTITTNNGSTDIDSAIYALSFIADDQVVVTAVVDVTLSVTLNSNSVNLGTLDTTNVNKGSVITTISTSAATGYTSLVKYDQTLTAAGPFTIPDTADGTIVANTSEYGAASSDSGNAIGIWSPTSCTTGASTSNATALSTSFQAYASNTVGVTNEPTTLCFLAAISGTQQPGSYTSTATLVTTAHF